MVIGVLKRILRNANLLRLNPRCIDAMDSGPTEVEFRPHGLVLDSGEDRVTVRLSSVNETGRPRTVGLRLLMDLDYTVLLERDACTLWAAVRTLEHVLQATERAAGERKQ